eukprot:GHRR01025962.1.p1 GENE.GHRR01025962.1~~GHRR01025962.1.p1  ORF type:complete len:125 (+),score=2.86 GHRR01025962.1:227-601(+)
MAHGQPAHEQHHFGHHSVRLEQGRHVAHLNNDVDVTVAEDEPPKGAVEDDIASIEAKPESSIKRCVPVPELKGLAAAFVQANISAIVALLLLLADTLTNGLGALISHCLFLPCKTVQSLGWGLS